MGIIKIIKRIFGKEDVRKKLQRLSHYCLINNETLYLSTKITVREDVRIFNYLQKTRELRNYDIKYISNTSFEELRKQKKNN